MPPVEKDANLLVGLETSDDAGVYRLTEDIALIQTVDYFTPVVDDPYLFGQIGAANALSDVYAMGGKPLTAMNLVGFPRGKLDLVVLAEILKGGADKIREAGAILVGGHTIEDQEPKYGLSVTGIAKPTEILTNSGAQVGDSLVLTKPIGAGLITTAAKKDAAPADVIEAAAEVMATLNKSAAEALAGLKVNAVTDITGFGLLGHTIEMTKGSKVGARIQADRVPVILGARGLAARGLFPGGTRSNAGYFGEFVEFGASIPEAERLLLFDAMTSGGLLISLPGELAPELIDRLRRSGTPAAAVVGEIVADDRGRILVE